MRKKIFCCLDIGNSKLTAVLTRVQNQRLNILANEELAVRGLSKGIVKDLSSLVDCVQEILDKLNKKSGVKIRRLLLSVNGNFISARPCFAAVALSENVNHHISVSDIKYLRRQARLLGAHIDETILHEFPQDYVLDDTHSTFNPLGLLAKKIQLNSYILSASHALLGNIKTAVMQAGYDVEDIIYSGVASSLSVLSEEEKIKGVLLVDLGACFTGLLFFKDRILRDLKIISFGGSDITDDISKGLGLSWELAEEIKKTSLILSAVDFKNSDTIIIRKEGSYKTLERNLIYESTRMRLDKFLDKIKDAIDSSVWKDKMECGIVGVGGNANLEGLLEKIETHTGIPTRLGCIKNAYPLGEFSGPQYSAVAGLLNYGLDFESLPNLKNYIIGKNVLERAINFISNLYQDYF